MTDTSEALFVINLPAERKTVSLEEIPELIGIALFEARFGKFDRETAEEDAWVWVHLTAHDHKDKLTKAARDGRIEVLNPSTLLPLEMALGAMLDRSLVRIPELRKYIESLNGAVQVAPSLSVVPQISSAPPPVRTVGTSRGPDLTVRYKLEAPDWEQWRRIDITRLWKAACLATNIEPPEVAGKELWAECQLSGLPPEFHAIWEAVNWDEELSRLEVLEYSGRMLWKTSLPGFAKWAIKKRFPIPPELKEIAYHATNNVPVAERGEQPAEVNAPEEAPAHVSPASAPDVPWQKRARMEADRLHLRDLKAGAWSSLEDISGRVAKILRESGVQGPRGPVSSGTILREALQGGRWKRPSGETGESGK